MFCLFVCWCLSYLSSFLAPGINGSLDLLADTLGGIGGLSGKYIHSNIYKHAEIPHSVGQ